MKKAIAKIGTFLGVFILSLIGAGFFMNMGNADMTAQMSRASLPIVAIREGDWEISQMRGYTGEMDPATMREGITLLGDERQVDAVIHTYGEEVKDISYEVRSVDGSRLVENNTVIGPERRGADIRFSFRLKDLIREGEEYSLIFLLTLENDSVVRYYTRVIQADYALAEKLDFIMQFSEATFDYTQFQRRGFAKKLEPNADGINSTLAAVNIHSNARQVAWGGLKVRRETQPEVQIREISPQAASAVLSYIVSYPENESTSYAQVQEYFRIRCTTDSIYLLDYERTAEQFLKESSSVFTNDKLSLGVTGQDVEMAESESGTVFAFCQAGSLYSYNGANTSLARLFSFFDDEGNDARTYYDGHGFKILQIDETGNVIFMIYGYMNRGRHEGRCGVQVCYYSSTMNVTEEMVFIPSDESAEILKAEMDNLAYVNVRNDLYLMMEGSLYHVNLEDKSSSVIVRSLGEDDYQVAPDGSMIAWQTDDRTAGQALAIMDLNSGAVTYVEAKEQELVRPLGFMGEDLIYGTAAASDVQEDSLGYTMTPMYSVVIRNFEGDVLKTYRQDGIYVTDCDIEGNQINLKRVEKTEWGFEETSPDQILYSDEAEAGRNTVETAVTENLQTVVQIALRRSVSGTVKILTPREVLFEESRDVELEKEPHPARYYVYGKTGVLDILSFPGEAVSLAYENMGTVAAEDGSYINKRDRLYTANQIMAFEEKQVEEGQTSLSVCLDAILRFEGVTQNSASLLASGKGAMEILGENLEDRKILNLQGCSLDMVLYYPDREHPVLALLEDGNAVLITGFNEQNVVILDPLAGTLGKMGKNDAGNWFDENGNRFIAYWE